METLVESDQEDSAGDGANLELEYTETQRLSQKEEEELLPESYRENSPFQIHMLNIADNFQRQFSFLFPERKPLLLSPLNECGVKKFVSTTLAPASMKSLPELHTWEGCACFVADFLSLVPLDPPEELPRTLCSPTSVLQSQSASCFESSSLLCSLLISINYQAYCVSGFAVREMCLLDQSLKVCPLLDTPVQSVIALQESQSQNKYALRPQRELKSQFLMKEEKKKQEAEAARLEKQKLQESEQQSEQPPSDPLRGLRRHCWVLVLSGSRGVQESFFIDPLTGNSFPTDDENFLGIDSVWDNFNYYVNMQDCSRGCGNVLYDLEDLNLWEPVLFGASSKKQLVSELSKRKESKMKINTIDDEKKLRVFNMPRSWVNDFRVTKEDLENRWPGKKKETFYRKAKLERFSVYLRPDGLVQRLTTYKDLNWTEELEVKEWFQNRRDHLEEREINKVDSVTSDRFRPGQRFHLTVHRFTDSEQEMLFNNTRVDHLVRRVESGSEMKEYFEGRADRLYFRHSFFYPQVDFEHAFQEVEWLKKVVERFHRNPSKPANKDVAERVYLLAHGRIEVTYHLDDGRVIPAKRSFIKPLRPTFEKKTEEFRPDMTTSFQPDPAEKPSSTLILYQEMSTLREEEEKVLQQVKQARRNVREILACRKHEDDHVEFVFTPWTTIGAARWKSLKQNKERLMEEEQRWFLERKNDVLSSMKKLLDQYHVLDSKKAKALYQDCLSSYKERLVEKANIIQERYDKEIQELQEKLQHFQKNQLNMTEQEVEQHHNDYMNKTLQIQVTKERLQRHKASASEKYDQLDRALRHDERLGPHL